MAFTENNKMKRLVCLLLPFLFAFAGSKAQQVLTLDSCRALALQNNKQIAIAKALADKAYNERRAAHTNFLPKVGLMAGYMRTGDEVSLLSNSQKQSLSNIGTNLVTGVSGQVGEFAQQVVQKYPDLAPLVQQATNMLPQAGAMLDAAGQNIVDAFRTDTRNLATGAIMLTQPLYMGGKIRAYDRITRYSEHIAGQKIQAEEQNVILDVDKAYWQVVSLTSKRKLAISYRDMLQRLDEDVLKMIAEGVATRANELSVSVKLNEAEMALTKVEDGLTLSRMLLAQICGLPINDKLTLADELPANLGTLSEDVVADVETAMEVRPELQQLALAADIYKEKVRIERSAFLPQLALVGGYATTYPGLTNGFEKKFRGTWAVGVTLSVPIWNWGEAKYKVNAAKAEANVALMEQEEAREKVELQVNQTAFGVNEANKKLALSMKNLEKAEENLRTANVGFREGVIVTSDLLAAQTAWLQANSDKIDAQIDVKLARSAYEKALGTLRR